MRNKSLELHNAEQHAVLLLKNETKISFQKVVKYKMWLSFRLLKTMHNIWIIIKSNTLFF